MTQALVIAGARASELVAGAVSGTAEDARAGAWEVIVAEEAAAQGVLDLGIPVVVIAKRAGEEAIAALFRAGAADVVLDDRLDGLQAAVNGALGRRAKEAGLRVQSLSRIGHDLKTQLNAIVGFSELLEQGVGGPLSPKQKEYLGHVASSGYELTAMIDEILDLAKIDAGRIELSVSRVELADLVLEAAGGLAVVIEGVEGTVLVDHARMRQALSSVLNAAARASKAAVRVSGALTIEAGGTIAAERTGLKLAARVAKLHGGELTIEGSKAVFRLPKA